MTAVYYVDAVWAGGSGNLGSNFIIGENDDAKGEFVSFIYGNPNTSGSNAVYFSPGYFYSNDRNHKVATGAGGSLTGSVTVVQANFDSPVAYKLVGTLTATYALTEAVGCTISVVGGLLSTNLLEASGTLAVSSGGKITSSGEIGVGSGGTGSLQVSAGGSLHAGGGLFVGYESGGSATIDVGAADAANISVGGGSGGDGSILITGGGKLSLTGSYDGIGGGAGASGTATVTGSGSLWKSAGEVAVGNSGTGVLQVAAGGTFEAGGGLIVGDAGSGSVTIDAASAGAGDISLGDASGGDGSIVVMDGGTLSLTGSYDGIGDGAGASGTATVTGSGSLWKSAGGVTVGNAGTGTLLVSSGGSFDAGGTLIVGYTFDGSATVDAANASAGDVSLGGTSGGDGSVVVMDGGALGLTGSYDGIGNAAGAHGTATVTGSGSLWKSAGAVTVGNYGTGTLLVSGGGSFDAAGGLGIGYAAGATGTVSVTLGGTLTSGGSAYVEIGNLAGSTGSVTVDGARSVWSSNGPVTVGNFGSGTLLVSGGGSFDAGGLLIIGYAFDGSATIDAASASAEDVSLGGTSGGDGSVVVIGGGTLSLTGSYDGIGDGAGASGTVTVSGSGSLWKSAGGVTVGNSGSGTLLVSSGGSFDAAGLLIIGYAFDGSATIDAASASAEDVSLGGTSGGDGSVVVMGGGTLSLTGSEDGIGNAAGASGTATVTGSGSLWKSAGGVTVGSSGSGTLLVFSGGSFDAGGSLTVGYADQGSVTIEAANASAEDVSLGGTSGGDGSVVVEGGGTLSLTGSYDGIGNAAGASGAATVTGSGSLWKSAGEVTVGSLGTGTLLVSGGGSFDAGGGLSVGYGGSGQLSIIGGSVVTAGTDMTIGQAAGTGSVLVDGAGSTLDAATWLGVGFDGVGSLTIADGGFAEVDISGQSLATEGYSQIGHGTTPGGANVTVTGSGSELEIDGALGVGWTGGGELDVLAGGLVQFLAPSAAGIDSMDIGNSTSGSGIVRVTGGTIEAGSNDIVVGLHGAGSLLISAGGSVDVQNGLVVAADAGSSGTVSVDGAGSMLSIGRYFVIGGGHAAGGSGSVSAANGGAIISSASVFMYAGSTLSVDATGRVEIGNAGDATAGSIVVDAGQTLAGAGTVSGAVIDSGTLSATGGTLLVSGRVTGSGKLSAASGAVLDLTGGGRLTETMSGAGTLQLDAATYTLNRRPVAMALRVDAGAALMGRGSLLGSVTDSGAVIAVGGILAVRRAVFGGGLLSAVQGATLQLLGGGRFAGTLGGAGAVLVGGTATLTLAPGASLSATNLVQQGGVVLGSGHASVALTNTAGDTYALSGAALTGATGSSFTNAGTFAASGSAEIGVTFINQDDVVIDSGALTFLGAVTNSGTVMTNAATATFNEAVGGTGTLSIDGGGSDRLLAGAGSGTTVDFLAGLGALDLSAPLSFQGTVAGFEAGDTIDLISTPETNFTYSGGLLTVLDGGTVEARIAFSGSYMQSSFNLASDGHGNTLLTYG